MTKKNQEQTKALISVEDLMNGSAIQESETISEDGSFPYLKMHHTIEQELPNPNHLHLYASGDPKTLNEEYSLVVVGAKRMARYLQQLENGKKRYTKGFEPLTGGGKRYLEITAMKEELEKDRANAYQEGHVYLCALMSGDVTCLVEFETCGIADSYWGFLEQATIKQRRKVTIEIADHKENLKKSKAGNYYFNPRSFTQRTSHMLSKEELETVTDLMQKNIAAINDWSLKEDNDWNDWNEEN